MTPTAALHKQIERYRIMTGEERLAIALDLHEVSCDIALEGIRHNHPEAEPAEIDDCSAAASNSTAPDDRTRTAGGLLAPFEPDWRQLWPQ